MEKVLYGKQAMSILAALRKLLQFQYEPPEDTCQLYSKNYAAVVEKILEGVWRNFGGLCLNCINNPKDKNVYVESFDGDRIYHEGCRFKHDEPTWYWSYQASRQQPDTQQVEREEREKARKERELKKQQRLARGGTGNKEYNGRTGPW